jgi:hypothetical protein
MTKNDLHHLRPGVFIKESLEFNQGYPKWKVWLYMPVAYLKTIYHMIKG